MLLLILILVCCLFRVGMFQKIFLTFVVWIIVSGKIVYQVREIYFYNLPGDQVAFDREVLIVMLPLTLVLFSKVKLPRFKKLNRTQIYILFSLEVFGVLLTTNFFTIIPLFQENVDAGRQVVGNLKGVGIGWFFLVYCGTRLVYDLLIYNFKSEGKIGYAKLFLVFVPFILYGGRSLILFPFFTVILYKLIRTDERKLMRTLKSVKINAMRGLNEASAWKYIPIAILVMLFLQVFGVWRAFGIVDFNYESLNWLIADLSTEYRSGVNVFGNLSGSHLTGFHQNIFSGLIPSFIFDIFGENKFDYYHNIGRTITANSGYAKEFDGGMRLGLIGELVVSSLVTKIVVISCIGLMVRSIRFLDGSTGAITLACIIFSIPYGINFLMNGMQIIVYSFCINWILNEFRNYQAS